MVNIDKAIDVIDRYINMPGGLLECLHGLQAVFGYVPKESINDIAEGFNISRAEVHGVISFYHDFKTHPVGRNRVQICRSEACQSMGSRQLESHAKQRLGIDYHQTTDDGNISLEPVYCLGNCACSPSIRVNDKVFARVDQHRFDELMADLGTSQ